MLADTKKCGIQVIKIFTNSEGTRVHEHVDLEDCELTFQSWPYIPKGTALIWVGAIRHPGSAFYDCTINWIEVRWDDARAAWMRVNKSAKAYAVDKPPSVRPGREHTPRGVS